ncbi:MAG: 3-keto-5-aminohexanoate cleavage protein [Firmicutes bacterium]|nr:3-keto-5-aminohexanoate cleavage protein [Bacillota bacterium]
MNPCIITCAITGAEVTKEQNPAVPYTAEEVAKEAYLAMQEGASIIHLHARFDDGTPTQDQNRFKELMDAIKQKCGDVIIQVSTGGALGMSRTERGQVLDLSVEMATLDCGTVNFGGDDYFVNTVNDITYFANRMNDCGVKYELECFEKGHVDTALKLNRQGIIKAPMHFSFVLGVPGGMTGEERDFMFLKDSIPSDSTFSVAGVGRYEFPLAKLSIQHGGHVRVGLEDNLYLEKGVLASSNKDLVRKVKMMIIENGRSVATVKETRQILGMRE